MCFQKKIGILLVREVYRLEFLFLFLFFFEAGSPVAQAGHEITVWPRMIMTLNDFFYFLLPRAGIIGIRNHSDGGGNGT